MENWLNFQEVLWYPWARQDMIAIDQLVRTEKEIIRIQMLLNLSYDEAKDLHKRMSDYAYAIARQTELPNSEMVRKAVDYAEHLMVLGQWDEIFWRSYVNRFLLF